MADINGGIYKIIVNDFYVYYGSSSNISRRWKEHIRYLRNGTHVNSILQRLFDKYGIDSFSFEVIEYMDGEDRLIEEQKYLDYAFNELPKEKRINLARDVHGGMIGKTHSKETRDLISKKGIGRKHSEKTKKLMSAQRLGKKKNSLDYTGMVISGVTFIKYSHTTHGNSYWECECHCGKRFVTRGSRLKTGQTTSCGCIKYINRERNRHGRH